MEKRADYSGMPVLFGPWKIWVRQIGPRKYFWRQIVCLVCVVCGPSSVNIDQNVFQGLFT